MMLQVSALDGGRLRLGGIDEVIAHCLRHVPAILERRDSGTARGRLYPDGMPSDPRRNDEWHRLMDDELRHLFESAAETFQRDLPLLDLEHGEIVFPAHHARAWMSAINQARIVLTELHGLTQHDFERDEIDVDSPHDGALAIVQVLAYVLQTLVEAELGEA